MKTVKGMLFFLCVVSLIFTFGQPAFSEPAGCQTGSGGTSVTLDTYPSAPGTKYEGPLTVYYGPYYNADGQLVDGWSNIMVLLRLRKGNQLWGFSGNVGGFEDVKVEDIQEAILHWFTNTVIPLLYPEPGSNPLAPVGCTPFDLCTDETTYCCPESWLKSIDQL